VLQPDGSYLCSGGAIQLVVDPQRGGRVVSLSLDGKNLLAGLDPSSAASPAEDKTATAKVDGGTLVVEGDTSAGLHFVKRYTLDATRRSLLVSYDLMNRSQQALRAAASEGQRVPPVGVVFYPSTHRRYPQSTLKLDESGAVTWFSPGDSREQGPTKALADGAEGWLAYAHDDLVLIRTFTDTPEERLTADRGEIEVRADYDAASRQRRAVELTVRGPDVEIASGAGTSWNVRWLLRRLPPSVPAKAGNQQLVGFVRGVIQ
jgi:hypothetical protein